jgi:hypothetical protein
MALNIAMQKNIGAWLAERLALSPVTDDGDPILGEVIDRLVQGAGGPLLSGVVIVAYTADLSEGDTLSIGVSVREDSADDFTDDPQTIAALPAAVVATGGDGGTTEVGVIALDVNLAGARRYAQAIVTPTLSEATDEVTVSAVWVLAGSDDNPASIYEPPVEE